MAGILQDKVAVITGGASGIGRATALAMAAEGARIALMDLGLEVGEEVAAAIAERGGEARYYRANVAQKDDVEGAFTAILRDFGRIDCAFTTPAWPVTTACWPRPATRNTRAWSA